MNWNDLKYFLALYRSGSLNGAAQQIGVNSTTVSRRIRQLESDLGAQLFVSERNRFLATDEAEVILPLAEQAEQQLVQISHRLDSRSQKLSGTIRITSVSTFINGYLLPRLADFRKLYPDIKIELVADAQQLSLSRREADLAIRMGRPEQGRLVISKLTDLHYAIYGAADSDTDTKPEHQSWVCLDERYAQLPEARWQQSRYPDASVAMRFNVGLGSVEAVKQGMGIAFLPCFLARAFGLKALSESERCRELWLLQHPELKQLQRLRVFIDWLKLQVEADKVLFYGE